MTPFGTISPADAKVNAAPVGGDAESRARAHLREWGTDSVGEHGDAKVRMLLAFAAQETAAVSQPDAARDALVGALERLVKLERRVLADMNSAAMNRGPGASSAMREDDRDDYREAAAAFTAARHALQPVSDGGEG